MSVGLTVYDVNGREFIDLCSAAEQSGIDAVWLGEHVVHPLTASTAHPTTSASGLPARAVLDADTELLDPFVALGAASAATSSLKLATGVYLLSLRHPLATARAISSLHELSGGRFMLGVGAGWLREEFVALGIDFASRYRRMEECLRVVRLACAGGEFSHDGEFYAFDTVQVARSPIDVPVILGGNTERAIDRALRLADGWISSGIPTLEEAIALDERIRVARESGGSPEHFTTYFRVAGRSPDLVDRYCEAGIEHIVLVTAEVRRDLPVGAGAFAEALRGVAGP